MKFFEFRCPCCNGVIEWEIGDSPYVMCFSCSTSYMVVKKDEYAFDLEKKSEVEDEEEEDNKWDLLVNQIINGEIIPVIGEDIILNGKRTVRQMLIQAMCNKDSIKLEDLFGASYSHLIYHPNYTREKELIYGRISNLIAKYQAQFKPSDLLKRILAIKQFPFIITTSSDPVAENAMRRIWEKERNRKVKTLVFNNDPKEVDIKGDISRETDIENPTIYYMFGKADTNLPHKFVVTDEDMLSFCQSWLTEGRRPKMLSRVVGGKSLLFLGCNYPDWLVRFIWYSMRNDLDKSGMLVGECVEKSLEDFMRRVHIEIQRDPEHVVDQIERRLNAKMAEISMNRFDKPVERTDVFISYSRSDENKARRLYDSLVSLGLNVWYDRRNLAAGDNWLERIKKSIESTKFFIGMVSESMKSQAHESHVYRKEWNMAIEHAKGMGSKRGFIIPVSLDGVDINDEGLDLPEGLTCHNAISIIEESDFDNAAKEVLKRINDLSK